MVESREPHALNNLADCVYYRDKEEVCDGVASHRGLDFVGEGGFRRVYADEDTVYKFATSKKGAEANAREEEVWREHSDAHSLLAPVHGLGPKGRWVEMERGHSIAEASKEYSDDIDDRLLDHGIDCWDISPETENVAIVSGTPRAIDYAFCDG